MTSVQRFAGETGWGKARGLNINAQLFCQFADQRGLWCFPRFNLAAWKLPQACHWPAVWTLLNQHPAIGIDQCRGDNGQPITL